MGVKYVLMTAQSCTHSQWLAAIKPKQLVSVKSAVSAAAARRLTASARWKHRCGGGGWGGEGGGNGGEGVLFFTLKHAAHVETFFCKKNYQLPIWFLHIVQTFACICILVASVCVGLNVRWPCMCCGVEEVSVCACVCWFLHTIQQLISIASLCRDLLSAVFLFHSRSTIKMSPGCILEARRVYHRCPVRSSYTWNIWVQHVDNLSRPLSLSSQIVSFSSWVNSDFNPCAVLSAVVEEILSTPSVLMDRTLKEFKYQKCNNCVNVCGPGAWYRLNAPVSPHSPAQMVNKRELQNRAVEKHCVLQRPNHTQGCKWDEQSHFLWGCRCFTHC